MILAPVEAKAVSSSSHLSHNFWRIPGNKKVSLFKKECYNSTMKRIVRKRCMHDRWVVAAQKEEILIQMKTRKSKTSNVSMNSRLTIIILKITMATTDLITR